MIRSIVAVFITLVFAASSSAEPFSLGNLLVMHNNTLFEYTLHGNLSPIHRCSTSRYWIATMLRTLFMTGTVVYTIVNYAPFDNDYISTYDSNTGDWTHTPAPVSFGNLSDRDLSILGDWVFRRGIRMNVVTKEVELFDIGMSNGPSETSVGQDGLLYSINSGSPRYRVQRTDPISLTNIGGEFQVRDSSGSRLNGRGLAVTESGNIYVD